MSQLRARRIRGFNASASLKQLYDRDGNPLGVRIRGFNASASLKLGWNPSGIACPFGIRGFNASASLKRGNRRLVASSFRAVSEALMPRPH